MARITVEDCIDKFPSRFELVLVASNRARKLHTGENPTVDIDNDKNTVIALREIAEETLKIEDLKNDLIEEYQTTGFTEDEDLNESEENSDQIENELENNNTQSEVAENDAQKSNEYVTNDDLTIEEPIESSQDKLENSSDEDKSEDL